MTKRLEMETERRDSGWYWIGRDRIRKGGPFISENAVRSDYSRMTVLLGSRFDLPKRRRAESPVQYYNRTGAVDDNFTQCWRGWYYCNPAHCKSRWRSKAKRDEHMGGAYAALA